MGRCFSGKGDNPGLAQLCAAAGGDGMRTSRSVAASSLPAVRNSRERVDHGSHRGLVAGADVVKVQHALHGPGLHAPHDGLGMAAEEGGALSWGAETERVHPEHTPRGLPARPLHAPRPARARRQNCKGMSRRRNSEDVGEEAPRFLLERGGRERKMN